MDFYKYLCKIKVKPEKSNLSKTQMALPIASIPVLTGETARRFETEAQARYRKYLNRTEEEKKADAEALERGFARLRRMLAKAHLE